MYMYTQPCAGMWLAGCSARGFCRIRTAREEAEYRVRSTTSSLSMSARPATMDHVPCKLVPAGVCTACTICRRCVTGCAGHCSQFHSDGRSIDRDGPSWPSTRRHAADETNAGATTRRRHLYGKLYAESLAALVASEFQCGDGMYERLRCERSQGS